MTELPLYHAVIEPAWIDYNGHLRDAYYVLVLSYAIDEMMRELGLDAAYRERTACTLFTLELHMHYLHEVKGSDELAVRTAVLESDRKRIHAGCTFLRARSPDPVATAEVMLIHVRQGERPASAPLPPEVMQTLAGLQAAARPNAGPGSRKIELKRR